MIAAMTAAIARPAHDSVTHNGMLLALTTGCVVVWQVGAYVDVWFHVHHGFEVDSFFTWAHALMYGGWAAAGLVPVVYQLWNRCRLSRSYQTYLVGVALFGLGGAADLAWHNRFGFEVGHDAVVSFPHLLLALAFTVAPFGLLQAAVAWRTGAGRARRGLLTLADLPLVLSLGMLLRVTGWCLIYADPLSIDFASAGAASRDLPGFASITWNTTTAQVAGSAGIFLRSIVLALFLVVPLRHLRLSSGSITLMMMYDALLIVPATDQWMSLPGVVGAAVAGEVVWAWMRRGGFGGPDRDVGYWVLGGVVPLVQSALILLTLAVGGGITWSVHVATGVPLGAGFLGAIVSVLAVPPAFLRVPVPVDRPA
jgi:hypothetical protein